MTYKHKLDGRVGERLQRLHDTPKELFYRGVDPSELLERPAVAIVGSRKMSSYGRAVTEQLARELAKAGVVIISGLALGIDSAAHQATVEAGGLTIAVMAHGLHTVQPGSHLSLARSIIATGGSLVSEYPDGIGAQRFTFVARDRLIAGLADAVLIPEAASKSGALHTAGFALDLGKPVMAVPGPITSETSAGTNELIKNGAIPITSVQDIFDALAIEPVAAPITEGGSQQENAILTALQSGLQSGADILRASKIDSLLFTQTLSLLEIDGRIKALGADQWALA